MKLALQASRFPIAVTTLAVALFFAFAIPNAAMAHGGMGMDGMNEDALILIQSVDTASNSVTFKDMKAMSTHIYKIDAATSITVNNNPGTFADIKAGMQVSNSTERDASTLDSITVVGKAAPAKSKSKNTGKKNSNSKNSNSNSSSSN